MAIMALTSERIELAGVDRSGSFKNGVIMADVAEQDVTTFASLGWKEVTGGIKSGGFTGTLNDDFAAGAIDSVLWPLLGTVVTLKVRATSAAISTSNPEYQTSVLIKGLSAGGKVGEIAEKQVSWPTSGVITRATA